MLFNRNIPFIQGQTFNVQPLEQLFYYVGFAYKNPSKFNRTELLNIFALTIKSFILPQKVNYCYVINRAESLRFAKKAMIRQIFINENSSTLGGLMVNTLYVEDLMEVTTIPVLTQVSENQIKKHPLNDINNHYNKIIGNVFTNYSHPFHLVDPSPWPFCTSIALWYMALTVVSLFHNYLNGISNLLFGFVYLAFSLAAWWRDVIRESTYEFKHTPYVRKGLLMGMMLFIISEIMFFFGFFWAFFHSSLVPSPYIGGVWPPKMLQVVSPWELPLVNTLCLLLSGVTLTISHRQLNGLSYYNYFGSSQWALINRLIVWLQITIGLGVFFLGCQAFEYYFAGFTFQDTVYGGTFYILTGLHGMHVLVGTIFLIVCLWRASNLHFTLWKQVGFKSAVWYWHFVDVVWIFLYLVIYVWGNKVV
jgi:heme/copper-type cytochrome/quinol oxidase subunit 3